LPPLRERIFCCGSRKELTIKNVNLPVLGRAQKNYFLINSTLLFFAFPSAVELSAIGFSSPNPAEDNLDLSIPAFTI
jgi:hypothetical protein